MSLSLSYQPPSLLFYSIAYCLISENPTPTPISRTHSKLCLAPGAWCLQAIKAIKVIVVIVVDLDRIVHGRSSVVTLERVHPAHEQY